MNSISVYLSDIKIFAHFGNLRGEDSIGGSPYFWRGSFRGDGVRVREGEPVGMWDEGYDASGGGGCAAVVFAEGRRGALGGEFWVGRRRIWETSEVW